MTSLNYAGHTARSLGIFKQKNGITKAFLFQIKFITNKFFRELKWLKTIFDRFINTLSTYQKKKSIFYRLQL